MSSFFGVVWVCAALLAWGALGGCSQSSRKVRRLPPRDAGVMDASRDTGDGAVDAGVEPFPQYCVPDGGEVELPPQPGGTEACPDDKRLPGCPCENLGETAPCWTGLRRNRNRGICQDGVTRCVENASMRFWGVCRGQVLPLEDPSNNDEACECFAQGQWKLENVQPCYVSFEDAGIYAVSTFLDDGGQPVCPVQQDDLPPPEPEPDSIWSKTELIADCAGQYELCYTLRAGDVDDPLPEDCVVAQVCTSKWYPEPGATEGFPPLPSWASEDSACATKMRNEGGYGEMSLLGTTLECQSVDDGSGGAWVFNRVPVCPPSCADPANAGTEMCQRCIRGAAGTF